MKFMVYYKHDPKVEEHLSKFVGKTYYKGIKLVDLREADVTHNPTGNVETIYVGMFKSSLVRYLLFARKICKYAKMKIGWKL